MDPEGIIKVSSLDKTWIFDLDGTIVKHNGYLIDGHDTLLDNAKAFLDEIPETDFILILTARGHGYREDTVEFLRKEAIRYDHILFNLPQGERILVNDKKPLGLLTAIAVNTVRNEFLDARFEIDEDL